MGQPTDDEVANLRSALERSRGHARLLIEASPDIAVLFELDGTVIDANDAAIKALGIPRAEFVGTCAYDHFEPSAANARRAMAKRVIETKQPLIQTDRNFGRVFDNRLVPLLDADGNVERIATYTRDVTELYRAAELVREQDGRRYHAERMEALGRVASGIAHDFNNLLTPIVNYTELLARTGQLDGKGKQMLDGIREGALQAAELTRQILSYGAEDDETLDMVSLGDLALELAELTRAASSQRIEVEVWAVDPGPKVPVSRARLQQAIMNLCLNAVYSIGEETGHIRIEVEATTQPAGVAVSVIDDGPGVPPEIRDKLFEPFFTTKGKAEGSGLGLFMAHGTASAHGGTLELESSTVGHTCFRLWLPSGGVRGNALRKSKVAPSIEEKQLVLLIDDQVPVLATTSSLLRHAGYQVRSFTRVSAADDWCAHHVLQLDAAIVDRNLADGDGLDVARHLRSQRPELRIVVITGQPDAEIAEQTAAIGVGLLLKPFTYRELCAALVGEPG